MLGIYVHIAYCRTICPYCDFVRERTGAQVPRPYVDALLKEIDRYEGPLDAGSVFFGGGTPSLLRPHDLEAILDALNKRFRLAGPEITLEANPDDITPELVQAWLAAGVNRVSLGAQSFDDRVLRYLGRRHDAARARRACELVRAAFDNWSMDLIFGAPPVEAWPETLASCVALDPPHVSAYGLTYEPGTPFDKRRADALPDDQSLRLYQDTEDALGAYDHYEISNFARPGRPCRHNLVYWRNEEYVGFGTGAFSYIGGARLRNTSETRRYIADPGCREEELVLADHEVRVETLIQHCRLREGLEKAYYRRRFGGDIRQHFGDPLDQLLARGLLEETATHIRPTQQGFYLNNEIGLALV